LVCDTACQVAPTKPLRTLDALHLATYLLARRRIENLELLTADQRLSDAARGGVEPDASRPLQPPVQYPLKGLFEPFLRVRTERVP